MAGTAPTILSKTDSMSYSGDILESLSERRRLSISNARLDAESSGPATPSTRAAPEEGSKSAFIASSPAASRTMSISRPAG